MLSKLAERRLTRLANYLESLPKASTKHFRMLHWFNHRGKDEHPFGEFISRKDLNYCGTSACAMGWAATIPAFKRAGLKLRSDGQILFRGPGNWLAGYLDIPARFFDIKPRQAAHLFGAFTSPKSPREWARRCRTFLKMAAKQ